MALSASSPPPHFTRRDAADLVASTFGTLSSTEDATDALALAFEAVDLLIAHEYMRPQADSTPWTEATEVVKRRQGDDYVYLLRRSSKNSDLWTSDHGIEKPWGEWVGRTLYAFSNGSIIFDFKQNAVPIGANIPDPDATEGEG